MMQDKTRTSGIKKLVNYSNQVKACKVQFVIVLDPNPKILSEVNQKSGPNTTHNEISNTANPARIPVRIRLELDYKTRYKTFIAHLF